MYAQNGVQEFSRKKALFVVVFEAKKDAKEEAKGEVTHADEVKVDPAIPVSPLASTDFFKTYEAKVGDFVLTDCYGHNPKSYDRMPRFKALASDAEGFQKVIKKMDKTSLKLFNRVTKKMEDDNVGKQVDACLTAFKKEWRGPEGIEKTVEVYNGILEKGREAIVSHEEAKKLEALEGMLKDFKGTGLVGEIELAIERVKKALNGTTGKEAETKEADAEAEAKAGK